MLRELSYKYHILFFTNTIFNAMVLGTTSLLQFLLFPKRNKRVKNITKLKPLSHSEVQNVGSSTQVDGSADNTATQVICIS